MIEKVNKILKKLNKKYWFYQAKDGPMILTENSNDVANDFLMKEIDMFEKRIINHLIGILKQREQRLKYSLLFANYGIDYQMEKYNEIKNIWEGKWIKK